ncbi:MAG: hypothetical protein BGP05_10510 [Rhizobiales bacterium 62-47]|nr:FAD binding domain-containing protein [Hyphomicrobiales bacterium]OJY12248.1 MAG: hypothetical protein BGP05_10510 [Rhizobiales bacterium 62-47]
MKAPSFDFVRPASIAEVTDILARYEGDARVLAGGQSLVPMLNLRLARPAAVVDISALAQLKTIEVSSSEIAIGALVTHAALEMSKEAGPTFDMLRKVASGIAYRGVRNRGTIGGSVAHADPAADWPSCLLALDARVGIVGPAGERQLPIAEFLLGSFTVALEPGEFVTRLHVPALSPGARWGYYKHNRKVGEFAEAIGCFVDDDKRGVRRVVAGALSSPAVVLFGDQGGWPPQLTSDAIAAAISTAAPAVEGDHIHFHAAAVLRALQGGLRP